MKTETKKFQRILENDEDKDYNGNILILISSISRTK